MVLKKILNYYVNRLLSHWLILLMDLLIVTVSFLFAYTLRFNFDLQFFENHTIGRQLITLLVSYTIGFTLFKPYSGII